VLIFIPQNTSTPLTSPIFLLMTWTLRLVQVLWLFYWGISIGQLGAWDVQWGTYAGCEIGKSIECEILMGRSNRLHSSNSAQLPHFIDNHGALPIEESPTNCYELSTFIYGIISLDMSSKTISSLGPLCSNRKTARRLIHEGVRTLETSTVP